MRRVLVLLIFPAIFSPAPLLAQDSLATRLRECAAIAGSVERLACYDGLAQRPVTAPLAAQVPLRPAAATPAAQTAEFGEDSLPQSASAPAPRSSLDSITSPVTDFSFDGRGHFIVTLANGQVWHEIEGDTVNVPLRKDRTHVATVSRAILGSYSIHFDNPRGLFKVVRVQ